MQIIMLRELSSHEGLAMHANAQARVWRLRCLREHLLTQFCRCIRTVTPPLVYVLRISETGCYSCRRYGNSHSLTTACFATSTTSCSDSWLLEGVHIPGAINMKSGWRWFLQLE